MGLGSLPPRSDVDQTVRTQDGQTWQLRWVYCGKPNCHRCPHGPYWYRLVYRGPGGTPRWRYAGKNPPFEQASSLLPAEVRHENG